MNKRYALKGFGIGLLILFSVQHCYSQIDSLARNLADTLRNKILVDDIPRVTFTDKLMYPHRWYVKQLLRPKITDRDTSYILNAKRNLTIALPLSQKFYGFNLHDLKQHDRLKFVPNNPYLIGFNFSTVVLTFGFAPGLKFGARPGRGNTSFRDYQLTLIGRRVITDINYQNYTGFYEHSTSEYDLTLRTPGAILVRPDLHVLAFSVNTLFVYNYKKYSLRGAFSFTDVQRKSAGSFMTGVYHSYVKFSSSDSTLVTTAFRQEVSSILSQLTSVSVNTFGVSGGYGYTYVYKQMLVSAALNLGCGGQEINYSTSDSRTHAMPLGVSANTNAKVAIRYDNLHLFTGIMATYDNNYTFNTGLFNTENYIGKVEFFIGYRFPLKDHGRRVLKALKLIDY